MIICSVRTCLYYDHGECDETDSAEFGRKPFEGTMTVSSRKECPFGRHDHEEGECNHTMRWQ